MNSKSASKNLINHLKFPPIAVLGVACLAFFLTFLTGCTASLPGAATLNVVASSSSLTVPTGTDVVATVNVSGQTGKVKLSTSGLPTGVTSSFSPQSAPGAYSLTVSASTDAQAGMYDVQINGNSGAQSATAKVKLRVTSNQSTPNFTLSASPSSVSLAPSGNATSTVAVNITNGITGTVTLAASGLPSGVTAIFNSPTTESTSTVTFNASSTVIPGTYTAAITGQSGSYSSSTNIALAITAPPPSLTPSFSLSASATSLSLAPGSVVPTTITVAGKNGFSGNVALAASGLPSGISAAFSPSSTSTTSTVTFAANSSVAPGTYVATIAGTSGTLSSSTSVSLTVSAPGFSLISSAGSLSISQGSSQASTISVVDINGFSGIVNLIASGLPAGITASFSAPSTNTTSTVTFSVSSSAAPGTYSAIITGSSGTLTASTSAISITVPQPVSSGPGTTWFIRPDGGTRYAANVPTGQCNGQADAPYPGSGVNRACAFNDVRYLWTDGSYQTDPNVGAPGWGWVIAGGDTVVIRGGPWRVGQSGPNVSDGFGLLGDPYGAGAPAPPSGTATQHTRILGACAYGTYSCTPVNTYPLVSNNLTQLYGGYGVDPVFNLSGSQYVDVEGIEITTHNGKCTRLGSPSYPSGCSTDYPLSDYATNGIATNNKTGNILLQDVYVHGMTFSGFSGPIGGPITMNRVFSGFNAFAGWNFDDGRNTPDGPGSSITANYVTMEGNGCLEQYPIVNTQFPALSCWDDGSSGFGDSWSGQDTKLDSFTCDHCVTVYNTKDGFIGPHTTITKLSITNSLWSGNMGQQLKWSTPANSTSVFENNVVIGNCRRMSAPLPGAPLGYNLHLSDFCRAAGDVFAFWVGPDSRFQFIGNTVAAYSATVFDFGCAVTTTCASAQITFRNNIVLGFLNQKANSPEVPGLFYIGNRSIKIDPDHDIFYNLRTRPCPRFGRPDLICDDPKFVNEPALTLTSESQLDNFNFHPGHGSPALAHGQTVNGLTTDFFGTARPNPPSIGAVER